MAHSTRRGLASSGSGRRPTFAWTTVFYLLFVLFAPLAFMSTANADASNEIEGPAANHHDTM
ncbi:hypothetical protein AAP_05691 [Ascosphaera apis ARSEF 7405]|uniref:Uncharacterized protein n=1 Tax=Ascosphaera apis ARSEF 7405 TaxID=392613 RepID=A0A166N2I6_9EURO|nr:hypothetical protein AAP_05691 [Ascosphaera apis ARSEF 7405]